MVRVTADSGNDSHNNNNHKNDTNNGKDNNGGTNSTDKTATEEPQNPTLADVIRKPFVNSNFSCDSKCDTNPGAKIQVSQAGLDLAAKVAIDVLAANINSLTIPGYSGQGAKLGGTFFYDINGVKVVKFVKPTLTFVIVPGSGLRVNIEGLGMVVSGNWDGSFTYWLTVSDKGTFKVNVANVSATISVDIAKSADGRLSIKAHDCSINIPNLDVTLTGEHSWLISLYNLVKGFLLPALKDKLENLLCNLITSLFNEIGNKELVTIPIYEPINIPINVPGLGPVFKGLQIDYRLVCPLVFYEGYFETAVKGKVFDVNNQKEAPFQPGCIKTDKPLKMFSAYILEYLPNTLSCELHDLGYLAHNFSKNDLSPSLGQYLSTNCSDSDYCFGGLFPDVAEKYPGGYVEGWFETEGCPVFTMTTDDIELNATFKVLIVVRIPATSDGQKEQLGQLMEVEVNIVIYLDPYIEDKLIKVRVFHIIPTVKEVRQSIIPGLDASAPVLSRLLRFVCDEFFVPKVNAMGKIGLPMPAGMDGVHPDHTDVKVVPGALVLHSDVTYTGLFT